LRAKRVTYTSTYTVTQADVDSGNPITNTATATGAPAWGTLTDPTADESVTTEAAAPLLGLDKPAPVNADEDGDSAVSLGDTLTYTITATNTGNTTQNNVVVSDPLITPTTTTCAALAPNATCVLTGTYVVTQADVDAGTIDNTAQVISDEVTTPVTDDENTPIAPAPALTIVKSAATLDVDADGSGDVTAGDTLEYVVTMTNTGNVTQNNVIVSDAQLTPASFTCATVAPGATCVLTGTHIVTQAEADAGQVVNSCNSHDG